MHACRSVINLEIVAIVDDCILLSLFLSYSLMTQDSQKNTAQISNEY